MFVFFKKHRKAIMIFALAFSIAFFLISYFNKNKTKPFEISFSLQQCDTNTGYSVAYDVKADYHKEKALSHFSIEGAVEESENLFRRTSDDITVYHVLDTDINNIFNTQNKLKYDEWDGEVYTADFNNQKIGKGAVYIEVYYLNDLKEVEKETVFYTDFLEGAVKGSQKELIKIEKKECDVRILLVYEVTNKLGTFTDAFRVNYFFSIRNGSKDVFPKTIGPDLEYVNEIPASTPVNTDILPGSTVFNGFRLDYAGNQFYTTSVYRNDRLLGIYDYVTIRNVYFTEEGFYKIVNKNAFDEESEFTLTVDRYKPFGTFVNWEYQNIFSGATAFNLNIPQGYDYRSPVSMEISKDGGAFKPYQSGEIIRDVGVYSIRLKNEFYTINYNFTVIETIIPNENYSSLMSLDKNNRPSKYYAFDVFVDSEKVTYCFSIDNYSKAYHKSIEIERTLNVSEGPENLYLYHNTLYNAQDLTTALNYYVEQNIYIKYADVFQEENLIFDQEMFNTNLPYLNNFCFETKSPIFSDKVYYLRQEDYPGIEELDLKTAKQYGKVFEYGIPVKDQLSLSGTYLILDTNIYEHTFAFKAYFVSENNAVVNLNYAQGGSQKMAEITACQNELSAAVDYFKINSINDKYDPYTVVKITFKNQSDYYIAGDSFKKYSEEGVYNIVCYDRNFNCFEFEITVKSPLGNSIILEGAEPDSRIDDAFKIYFDMNCQFLEIKENDNILLYILEKEIVTSALVVEYDEIKCMYYITFEKKPGTNRYFISFINEEGSLEKFSITMVCSG